MNFWTLFWGLVLAEIATPLPLLWQLVTPQKAVKFSLFNANNHICTFVNDMEKKYMQKSVHKLSKKAKMGAGGKAEAGGWNGPGREWRALKKQWEWMCNDGGGYWEQGDG